MRGRNLYIYNADESVLKTLQEEYESMGRYTKIEGSRLCVYAGKPPPPPKEKKRGRKPVGRPGAPKRTGPPVR